MIQPPLMDVCPGCGASVSWVRNEVARCPAKGCGFYWPDASPRAVADEELELTRYIYRLCGLSVSGGSEIVARTPLAELELADLLSALFFVASQFVSRIDTKGKHLVPSRRSSDLHNLLVRSLRVFAEWPGRYHEFLDERRAERARKPRAGRAFQQASGWQRYFGEYKSALFVQLGGPQFDSMRHAFSDYVLTKRRERLSAPERAATGQPEFRVRPLPGPGQMSGNEARHALGTDWTGLKRLFASGKVSGQLYQDEEGQSLFFIERASVERLKADRHDALYLEDVALLLGTHNERVKELVESGVLIPLRGPFVDGSAAWQFGRRDVYRLLEELRSKVRKLRAARALGFKQWPRKLERVHITLGTFVQAVLADEISPCGRGQRPGLAGLLFSEADMNAFAMDELHLRAGDVLSIPEVAVALGVNDGATRFLVKKGIIRAEVRPGLEAFGCLADRGELDAFNASYALPAKLAPDLKTSPGILADVLRAQGIEAVCGHRVDGAPIYVFRRSDLAGLDLKGLLTAERTRRRATLVDRLLLDEKQAAALLGVTRDEVTDLVRRGVLAPHKRLPRAKQDGLFFSVYAVKRLQGRVADFYGLVSVQAAAELLGISESRLLVKYVYAGKLMAARREGKRGQYFFRKADVMALVEAKGRAGEVTMISAEVAQACEVNMSCVHKWVVGGILTPVSGPKVDGAAVNRYSRDEVQKLHAERMAYRTESLRAGKTARYGRPLRGPKVLPCRAVSG